MTAPVKLNRSHDQWRALYAVESESNPEKFYTVGQKYDGTWACDCPAWIYHTPRKPCKHIKRLMTWVANGEQADRAGAVDPRAARLQARAEQNFDAGRARFIELD